MTKAFTALELTKGLLQCPSVTPLEGGALTYLQDIMHRAGFRCTRLSFKEQGTPTIDNLYAEIGEGAPHLMFAGHTDVVPVGDEKSWAHPPFAAKTEDGKLFGRGAVDMKGGIACFLAATLAHLKMHPLKNGTISFLITGDEEGPAINGTVKMLEWFKAQGKNFDHCIVGEPTNPNFMGEMLKIGRRGSLSAHITIVGKQGHVAYPHLAHSPIPALHRLMGALLTLKLDDGNAQFQASNLEITSIDVGNNATNIIPEKVSLKLNIRYNNAHTLATLKARLEGLVTHINEPNMALSIAFLAGASESFLTQSDDFIAQFSASILAVTGKHVALSTSGGTSDARFIKNYGPVIEFGLVGQTMHQINEHVALQDLETLEAIYFHFIRNYFGSHA